MSVLPSSSWPVKKIVALTDMCWPEWPSQKTKALPCTMLPNKLVQYLIDYSNNDVVSCDLYSFSLPGPLCSHLKT